MTRDDWFTGLAMVGVVVLLVLAITDFVKGRTYYYQGTVRSHLYDPAHWSESGSGKDRSSEYHEAKYHLVIWVPQPEHAVKLSVNLTGFTKYADGETVQVAERRGRWTNFHWYEWLPEQQLTAHDY